ncbi:hypothetical protein ACIRRA_13440 [Nocardia sp. NPDC101769]|uniref:hypothetical protein n=1 Tax=Nocardia sp. NPDC101769 TaxID=3364333 RepID=UPI0038219DC4
MPSPNTVTALLVAALESSWAAIRANHPDVPEVVLTIGSGATAKGLNYGHFAPHRWVRGEYTIHELFVGGEGLDRGPADVLGTLLHEAAHGVATTRGIKDTSRQGRWHNQRFRDLGRELGLTLAHDEHLGWSLTTVPEPTRRTYQHELDELDLALVAYRRREPEGRGKGSSNGVAAACGCGRRIRVAIGTFAIGPITCGLCQSSFESE